MNVFLGLVCSGLLLSALGVGHSLTHNATECSELSDHQRSTQCSLYEYAQIADLAYGPGPAEDRRPANMCTVGDTGVQVGIPDGHILVLPSSLKGKYVTGDDDVGYWPPFDSTVMPLIPYQGNDNVTRLACRREEDVRLSLSVTEVLVRSALYIYFDIRLIAPVSDLVGNLEEMDVVNMQRVNPRGESDDEQLM